MARTTRVSTLPQAFSLIELLVVIGIIALLLALALPALGSARTHARKSDCLSDMHQVGLALTLYANDYDDRLPLPNWGPVAAAPGWLYGPGINPQTCLPGDRQTGALWEYTPADKAYRCPSHDGPFTGTAVMTSYMMNGAVIGYGRKPVPYMISAFRATDVPLWDGNEKVEFGPPYNDGASFPTEIVPGHHGTSITCMVVDASSVSIAGPEFLALRSSLTANRMWCTPGSPTGR